MGAPMEASEGLRAWLTSLGLQAYLPRLVDNGYDDLDMASRLGHADLDAVGVADPGHRRALLDAAAALLAAPSPLRASPVTSSSSSSCRSSSSTANSGAAGAAASSGLYFTLEPHDISLEEVGKSSDRVPGGGGGEGARISRLKLKARLLELLESEGLRLSQPRFHGEAGSLQLQLLAHAYSSLLGSAVPHVLESLIDIHMRHVQEEEDCKATDLITDRLQTQSARQSPERVAVHRKLSTPDTPTRAPHLDLPRTSSFHKPRSDEGKKKKSFWTNFQKSREAEETPATGFVGFAADVGVSGSEREQLSRAVGEGKLTISQALAQLEQGRGQRERAPSFTSRSRSWESCFSTDHAGGSPQARRRAPRELIKVDDKRRATCRDVYARVVRTPRGGDPSSSTSSSATSSATTSSSATSSSATSSSVAMPTASGGDVHSAATLEFDRSAASWRSQLARESPLPWSIHC
uniref:Uncharacterized protein LOC116956535 isoform X2 n=1 Tax=Petromyzon marinus TaxID=7757 RepID=A0AAJ7XH02_PETMA|nr:uncharacterized protein LOC116956535 isoform X2 [Petromyzon marinus]